MTADLNHFVDLQGSFSRPEVVGGLPVEPLGAELANHLADRLPAHGIEVLGVVESEEGSYVKCSSGRSVIELMVSSDAGDFENGRWSIMVCSKRTFFGRVNQPESALRPLLFALDRTLKEWDSVSDVRWFPNFDSPEYLALVRPSVGPIRDPKLDQDLPFALQFDRTSNLAMKVFFPWIFVPAGICLGVMGKAFPALMGRLAILYIGVIFLIAIVLPVIAGNLVRVAARKLTND